MLQISILAPPPRCRRPLKQRLIHSLRSHHLIYTLMLLQHSDWFTFPLFFMVDCCFHMRRPIFLNAPTSPLSWCFYRSLCLYFFLYICIIISLHFWIIWEFLKCWSFYPRSPNFFSHFLSFRIKQALLGFKWFLSISLSMFEYISCSPV